MHNSTITVNRQKVNGFLVTTLTLKAEELPSELHGYRIVQLSDFHFGPATSAKHIVASIELSNHLKPDLVFLSGDYIQLTSLSLREVIARKFSPDLANWKQYRRTVRDYAQRLSIILQGLESRFGIYGSFGNHDYLEGIGTIKRQLGTHITWLNNTCISLPHSTPEISNFVRLAAVDDTTRGKPDLKSALMSNPLQVSNQSPQDVPPALSILISHNPDITLEDHDNLLSSKVNLLLCGHTHGGQICLPGSKPLVTRTKQKKHIKGLSLYGCHTHVYVSNGVGYGGIRLRTFCPPELVSIELQKYIAKKNAGIS